MSNMFEEKKRKQEAINTAMSKIKHVIAVASGKGGVGKSTVAANIAISLAKKGYKVGLADAEIDGKQLMLPFEKFGIKMMSVGFFVDKEKPMLWRGPMAANTLTQLLTETHWGELDFMVLDMPPGTGDIQLTLVQQFSVTGSIFVCTPQQLAVADVRRAVNMFKNDQIAIPIIGLVENMAYFTPKELPNNKYYIFGKGGAEALAKELDVELIAQIPISMDISETNDNGNPISLEFSSPEAECFMDLAEKIAEKTIKK